MFETDQFLNSIRKAYFLFSRQVDGTIISVSEAVTPMLGYNRSEFKHLFAEKIQQGLLKNNKSQFEYETQINHKNGSSRWLQVIEMPVFNQASEIKSYDCIVHDITTHKNNYLELLSSEKTLRNTLGASIRALAASVESRDSFSYGHHQRSSSIARLIAQELGVSKTQTDTIRLAGVIHDIGKITVPLEILNKKDTLSEAEYGLVQGHPEAGYMILKDLDLPWPLAEIVLQHHEKLDGSGYPNHLRGDQILPETKILTVADIIEAMASDRVHRPAIGLDTIIEEITAQRNVLYDPDVVDASVRLLTEKRIEL
ncbi:HD domain-containing phosphohydrolase [Thermodesulfobacteriota bacterium]